MLKLNVIHSFPFKTSPMFLGCALFQSWSATGLSKPLWTSQQPGYIAEHVQCNDGSHPTPNLNTTNPFLNSQNTKGGIRLIMGLSTSKPSKQGFLVLSPKGVKDPLCHLQPFTVQTLMQLLCSAQDIDWIGRECKSPRAEHLLRITDWLGHPFVKYEQCVERRKVGLSVRHPEKGLTMTTAAV